MKIEREQQFLRTLYEAFNRRDMEVVLTQMQPDVEVEPQEAL